MSVKGASEVIALKPENIDSKRMLIKVKGKGGKDRYTLLAKRLLPQLRHYYRTYRPQTYLFPSSFKHKKHQPLSYGSVRSIYEKARKKAGVKKGAGIHTMRHYAEFQIMPSNIWKSGESLAF